MVNLLEYRLKRLERYRLWDAPLADLTDVELDRRIIELACKIKDEPLDGAYYQKLCEEVPRCSAAKLTEEIRKIRAEVALD